MGKPKNGLFCKKFFWFLIKSKSEYVIKLRFGLKKEKYEKMLIFFNQMNYPSDSVDAWCEPVLKISGL